ncbi:MAG: tRNA1(Val) (adenine(37)-N6)-methyltransferase [Peptostreptococcaceae bacterium]|nr:tRNA1(Val) (adenine(37)-N6)-methyltransferase [Peptostreptococcaceae bacterium]
MIIKAGESLDTLGIKDYKIIQRMDGFKFGIDAVLLANFVSPKKNDVGIDLGSGTGVIPTIILAKSSVRKIIGVEIQSDMVDLSDRSKILNGLENELEFMNIDIKKIPDHLPKHSFDFVTSNPPYYKPDTLSSPNRSKNIARHETAITLEDIFEMSGYLLKPQKPFYIIHKPERLVELFEFARKNKLEPKEIRFIHPSFDRPPNLVLIRYVKNGNMGLKYRKPLYVYDSDRNYTVELMDIYQNKKIGE